MRRKKWRHVELCLVCWSIVDETVGQRLRVEFESGYFVSVVICQCCAHVMALRGVVEVTVLGRTLRVHKRDAVGPHRIRGDGTWSCRGEWL